MSKTEMPSLAARVIEIATCCLFASGMLEIASLKVRQVRGTCSLIFVV